MKPSNLVAAGLSTLMLMAGATQLAYGRQPDANTVSYMPPEGYVPNAKIAVEIAEIVAEPIYGKAVLASEQPLEARLEGEVWIVNCTLPKGYEGGTLECRISKRTGQILRMIHGK